MKKIYHLGNCTTCRAIIKETGIDTLRPDSYRDQGGFIMQNIKFVRQ